MVVGVHHASVTVSDVEKSIAFYRDILGLKLLYTQRFGGEESSRSSGVRGANGKIAVLKAGDDTIELIQYFTPGGKPYDRSPHDIGNMHIAFRVTDVHKTYDELMKKGIKFRGPPVQNMEGPMKGWVWTYFNDPDGAQLELVEQR